MADWITHKTALEALERIYDKCEELENHLPTEEREGYRMFPDYETVRNYLTETKVVRCKDCYWWEKYQDSVQGRCFLSGGSPAGGWFCANGRTEEADL